MSLFSMGRVISLTFRVLGRNFASIGTIALIMTLVITAAQFAFGAGLTALGLHLKATTMSVGSFLISQALQSVLAGAVTCVVIADLDQRRVGIGRALGVGSRLAFPLMILSVVVGLGVGIGAALFLIPGVVLALRWLVATPVRVVEGPSISRAISRSAELTKTHRWALLGLVVAFFVLAIAVVGVGERLGIVIAGGLEATSHLVALRATNDLATTITSSISATGIAVCYVELRRALEGVGIPELVAVFA